MDCLNTNRKSMQKLDQISTKQFVQFLHNFLPAIKNGKIDTNKVLITEKPDGSAIRVAVIDGELYFESSYSGLSTWDNVPFKEAAKWIYDNLKDKLVQVSTELGYNFKLVGELIWCFNNVEGGKVTPVGTTYEAKFFGEYGACIIINAMKITNDSLEALTDAKYTELVNKVKQLNSDMFKWFVKQQDLVYTEELSIDLDIDMLTELINSPEINKDRLLPKQDADIIKKIEEIRIYILERLEELILAAGGHFSLPGELIEGVVLTFNDGTEYGVFSKNYKQQKEKYYIYQHNVEITFNDFLQAVFGNKVLSVIVKKLTPEKEEFIEKIFDSSWDLFKAIFKSNYDKLIAADIPKATKNIQLQMFEKKMIKYNKIETYKDFKREFLER